MKLKIFICYKKKLYFSKGENIESLLLEEKGDRAAVDEVDTRPWNFWGRVPKNLRQLLLRQRTEFKRCLLGEGRNVF